MSAKLSLTVACPSWSFVRRSEGPNASKGICSEELEVLRSSFPDITRNPESLKGLKCENASLLVGVVFKVTGPCTTENADGFIWGHY